MTQPISCEPRSALTEPTSIVMSSDISPPSTANYILRVTATSAGHELIIPQRKSFLVQNEGGNSVSVVTEGNSAISLSPGSELRVTWSTSGLNHELQASSASISTVTGTVVRYTASGSVVKYEPTSQTGAAYWIAAKAAVDAIQDGDTIEFSPVTHLYTTTYLAIANKENWTLRGGRFSRGSGVNYQVFLQISNCKDWTVEQMEFDGASGMQAPGVGQSHVNTNGNTTSNATFIDLVGTCSGGTISKCLFADHVGQETFTSVTWPIYFDANAVRIPLTCDNISVIDCTFRDIGNSGIEEDGRNTIVSRCTFNNCLNQGISAHANSGVTTYKSCRFFRRTSTILGYTGGINVNTTVANGLIDVLEIEGCTFEFPYDNSTGLPVLQTQSPLKVQGIKVVRIKNTRISHGLNPDATNGRASITIQDRVDSIEFDNAWLAGCIRHITRVNNPDFTLRNTKINQTAAANYGMLTWMNHLLLERSAIKYNINAIASPDATGRVSGSFVARESSFEPDTINYTTTRVVLDAFIEDVRDKCCFGPSNRVANLQHGTGAHSKSNTVSGNLTLSTLENDPTTKVVDATLTGSLAHPTFGSSPEYAPAFKGASEYIRIRNTEYRDTGLTPAGATDVSDWTPSLTIGTFDNGTDEWTKTAHGYADGDIVRLRSSGTLPTGFAAGTKYYVINQTANTFQLSLTSGGAAVNGTSNGTGDHYVKIDFVARFP